MTKSKNIIGIGGFSFHSKNPHKLKEWYIDSLGVDIQKMIWMQEAGPTVFKPFPKDSDYFNENKQWMINFRVKNLQKLISELQEKSIKVEQKEEWNSMPEIGTFARIHDLEGNPIELWEPASK